MIHLVKHGREETPEEKQAWEEHYQQMMSSHIIIRKPWCGKLLSAEDFQKFQDAISGRRPWCSEDRKEHHFIDHIARNPEQAAMLEARNQFYIKVYS